MENNYKHRAILIFVRKLIFRFFPTKDLIKKIDRNSESYINLCYSLSKYRSVDSLKLISTPLLVELNSLLKGKEYIGTFADGVIYWLSNISVINEYIFFTRAQITTLILWFKYVSIPLYGDIAHKEISVSIENLKKMYSLKMKSK